MNIKGTLVIIGGNEDKGQSIATSEQDHLEFIEDGILSRVVKESGGVSAKIVIIPTASRIPDQVAKSYLSAFEKLGCKNVEVADIRSFEDAEKKENIQLIEEADCVMFSGGDQSQITRKIGGSKIHNILQRRYQDDNFVIAGTSAGAMCMSEKMITGGNPKEFFKKGTVKIGDGMGFIPNLIIDSHFIRRKRFGRLAEAVAHFPHLIGIGLAEDTGLVVKKCNSFEVIGSGMVILFDGNSLIFNNESKTPQGEAMTVANLKTHVLADGFHFNIEERKVYFNSTLTV
ncbi:cyanophycinase [Mesonia maritima]|uniref:Cyanophycinase n=1 Tax=Mesonia maritima TaxID=1793873 RepID=A0ABU1K922_9FLAO|nr:cyanophycinase [Mesonia maritima]MDR6301780.1 cyanophycinase [Mesonia maritima]